MHNKLPLLLSGVSRKFYTFLLLTALLLFSLVANASHFRGGNIKWERMPGNPYQIKYTVSEAWRTSAFFSSTPTVGTTVTTGSFFPGTGSFVNVNLVITSVNATEDWFAGSFTYIHTFPTSPAVANYVAYEETCCRISGLSNNNGGNFRVETTVTLGNNNDGPVSSVPPFISLPRNTAAATYQIPATDPNGDGLTYSLTPANAFGSGTTQPTGLSISSTGLLTFNTTGMSAGQLWSTSVKITDSKGATTMVDLMIKITNASTPPVYDYTVTPANNFNYLIQPGQTVSFNVRASDVDAGDNVSLSGVGIPVGATFTPGSGNPVTRPFSWTPTTAQLGTFLVNFIAQDNAGIQTNTIVKITVSLKPTFNVPSLANNSFICLTPGVTRVDTFKVSDPDTADRVVLSAVSGVLSGMAFSPSLPTAQANPRTVNFSWTPTAAQWGIKRLVLRGTDTYNETTDDTVYYIVNNPPTFTTTQGNATIFAGQLFSYTFGTADANIPQGDVVDTTHIHLPSWLSLVNNNNGTFTLSGTPSIADSGAHTITLNIEDDANHIGGTHCGQATQVFTLTVQPCNITTSTVVTDVTCPGFSTGAIDLTVNNATAPVTYAWSNSATTQDISGVAAGTYSVSITDANGCTANTSATINTIAVPDINVIGNAVSIADGDNTPSTTDNTDFGTALSKIFTIENTGTANLVISTITFSGANASDFSVSGISQPVTIGPGSSNSFNIICNPTGAGVRSATITINSNDCDEGTYDYAVQTTAVAATALHFDGWGNTNPSGSNVNTSVYDYISVPDNGTLDLGNTYTIEARVFLNDNTNNTIIDKGDYRYLFQTHPNGNQGLGLYNNAMGWVYSSGTVPTNQWVHIAVTFDVPNNRVTFYLNGNILSTHIGIANGGVDNGIITIGRQQPSSCVCNNFDGKMDELRVWTRALCQSEIQNNMNCELNPSGQTGLAALYYFNQGYVGANNSGVTTAIDASGSGNTGTLTNFALNGATSNWSTGNTAGACTVYTQPEINVKGNSLSIVDGDNTPSATDHTNFGNVSLGTNLVRTFTIENTGTANLTVSTIVLSGANPAEYAITGIALPATIATSSSTTFNVVFTPTTAGNKFATVTINSNDCDESVYDYAIQGFAFCAPPTGYNVTGGGSYCSGGAGVPVGLGGSEIGVSYQLYNNAVATGSPVLGTGAPISFGNQTAAGTYTVVSTRVAGGCIVTSGSVTVTINAAPSFTTCPSNITTTAAAGLCSQTVTYTAAANGTPAATLTYALTGATTGSGTGTGSGSVFNVGVTTVTITASNLCSNVTCTFTVTVTDNQNPTIANCPSNITKNVTSGQCGTNVTWVLAPLPPTVDQQLTAINIGTVGADQWQSFTAGMNGLLTQIDLFHNGIQATDFTLTVYSGVGTGGAVLYSGYYNYGTIGSIWLSAAIPTGSQPTMVAGNTYTFRIQGNGLGFVSTYSSYGNYFSSSYGLNPCFSGGCWKIDFKTYVAVPGASPTANDNCGVASFTSTHNPGAFFPVGTTPVAYTATDIHGNTSTCSFNVTVVDNQTPSITCPANITVNNDAGICGAVVTYTAPVGTDNCAGATTAQTGGLVSGATFPIGNTINTFVVTDAAGNTNTCSFNVTVVDNQPPSITCPANITVNNDPNTCGAIVTYTAPVGTDNCPGATTAMIAGRPSGSLFAIGTTTNTFEVTDVAGNKTSCSFTVTVVDNQAPAIACPSNIVRNNDPGVCGAVVTYAAPVGTDNCPGSTTIQIAGLASGTTFPVGTTTNTFRVTDAAGNSTTCSFTVTINDNQAPAISCPANITVNNTPNTCGSVVTYTTPVGTDNCAGTTTTRIAGLASGSTFPVGVTTNTYRVIDAAGNSTTCSFTVTVLDVQPPVITCPANITVNNNMGICGAVVNYTTPTATDNCSGGGGSGLTKVMTFTGSTFVTTYTEQGMTIVANAHIDIINFARIHGFYTSNWTYNGGQAFSPISVNITANPTLHRFVSPTGAQISPTTTGIFTFPNTADWRGITSMQWNNLGNVSNLDMDDFTFMEGGGGPTITRTSPANTASGSTFPVGTTTVSYTATDSSGNTASCSFTVTVVDNQAPAIACPSNIVRNNDPGVCGAVVTYAAPVGTDNCPGSTTIQIAGLASGTIFPVGTTTNTFRVTDAAGNSTTCSFTVTISDNQAPAISCPANITVNNTPNTCGSVVTYTTPVGTDNCPGATTVQTAGMPSGSTFPVGTTTNTFVVTDVHSNTNTCSFTVTVTDNENPVIVAPANIVVNNDAGICGAVVNYVTPIGTDNCPGATTVQTAGMASGSTFPVGTTTNTFVVTDAYGHNATASFTVTVTDNENPVIIAPANIAVNNDAGICGAVVTYTAPVGTDNCPGATTAQTAGLVSGAIFPVGTTTNTFVVTDAYGNTATTSFTVTVTDNENPSITAPANIAVNNDAGICGALVTYTAPVGTDNCPGATTAQIAGLASGSTFPVGTTTNTFVATDAYGNTATTSFTVTVTDNEVPVLSGVPANATVSCDNVPAPAVVTASDNCSTSLPVTYSQIITNGALPSSGLKGFWNFNENAGTTTVDQTSNGNNGTLSGGVSWTPGQSGSAVQFPGTGNNYVQMPNGTGGALDTRYSVSMFAWYWPGTNGSQQNPIIQYNANGWGTHLWQTGSNQLFVRFTQRNTLSFTTALAANSLIPNQWNCVGATYDYATGTAKLWCNGVNVQTLFIGQMELSTNHPVRVGSVDFDGRRTNSKVDNVAIYDRALSASEISQLCAVTCPQNYTITRTWSATDAHNNTTTASQTVTVKDTTAPVLTVPANIVLNNQTGMCSAVANFQATATDNCSNNLTITYSQNSGTAFPVGNTIVTVTAKDECGNTSTGTFTVTVTDNEVPSITCSANIAVNNDAGVCGAVVNYTAPAGTDNCPGATTVQTAGLPSGSTFPVGTTTNTFVVTDAHSNTNTCSFTVTVTDNEAPTISIADVTVNADNGSCAATNVNLGVPATNDNCAVNSVSNNALTSYPVGNTTVTWNVLDIHGNTSSTTHTVTVIDNQTPIVNTQNITVYLDATGSASITAADVNNNSTDNCGILSMTVSPNTFSCSNVNANTVTLTVNDIHGNTASNIATVTVVDTVKPVITCPVDITVSCLTQPSNTGTATATDACGINTIIHADVSTYSANITDAAHYNYTITRTWTAMDVNGNSSSCTQVITVQQLKLTASIINVACYGTATGSIDLTVQGGVGALSYLWSNSASTQDINSLILGTYSVTVTDAAGCQASATYTVTEPTLLTATAISVTPNPTVASHALNTIYLGYGPQSVTLSSTAAGGTPGYTYSWSPTTGVANPSSATTSVSPIVTTTYTLTITDANGCTKTVSKTIYVQDVRDGTKVELCHNGHTISVSVSAVPAHLAHGDKLGECFEIDGNTSKVSCYGGNNGAVNISVEGSVPPYTYSWSNGATTEDISGLTAGNYTVTVTSANGEIETATFTVSQYSKININSNQNNVRCYGDSTGSISVSVSGGNDPYNYLWNNGSTSRNRYNLPIGTYIVTVTDDNGCTMKDTTVITQPSAPLAVTGVINHILCNGDETGDIDITVTGGTGPYSYDWDDNSSNHNYHNSCHHSSNNHWCNHHSSHCDNNNQDLNNVDAGSYTVTVTDANGCEKTVTFIITEPAEIAVTAVKTNVSCNGGNNGAIDVSVSGGVAPYTYLWSNGTTTQDRTGLTAGTYSVTVKDANNCTKTISYTITQPAALALSYTRNNVSCYNGSNGSINLSVSGGTSPYTYVWSNSAATQDISSLVAGTYTVTVTDSKGCSATTTITITQPSQLMASNVITNVSCNGDDDGAIDVSVSGGTAPYTYTWTGLGGSHSHHSCSSWWNSWCSSHNSWSSCHNHSQDISGIEAGTYSVVITDANGCSISMTLVVTEPSAITVTAVKANVTCYGSNNGAINITAAGGTPPYTYKWNNNSTVEDRTGLAAGNYSVEVKDAKGCTKTVSYTITQPAQMIATTQVSGVSCYGSVNGSINLSISGGTSPYTYLWSNSATTQDINGLTAGTYTVVITDSNGCTVTKSATVTQPALLAVSSSVTNVSCYGDNDGEIDITVTGGTSPYTYKWDNNMTCRDRSGLTAGNYSLTVKDANNCTQTIVITVAQPAQLNVTGVATNTTCYNSNNGAINITATGGTAPYTYRWNNNSTVEDRTGLSAGTYSVKVRDAKGCEKTVSFTVTQPNSMSAAITMNPNPTVSGQAINTIFKGYGPQTVSLSTSVSGGTAGYTYSWSPTTGVSSATSATTNVTPVSTTTYTVTITDAGGCTKTVSKTIEVLNVQNGDYIRVCHNGSNISVPVSSVATHLAHGDDLGYCSSNCRTCPAQGTEEQPDLSAMKVKELKVYPNPSTGKFTVELPDNVKGGEASILDMAGKLIQRVRFNPDATLVFDLGDVAKGVYMVQIVNGGNTYRALVTIQE